MAARGTVGSGSGSRRRGPGARRLALAGAAALLLCLAPKPTPTPEPRRIVLRLAEGFSLGSDFERIAGRAKRRGVEVQALPESAPVPQGWEEVHLATLPAPDSLQALLAAFPIVLEPGGFQFDGRTYRGERDAIVLVDPSRPKTAFAIGNAQSTVRPARDRPGALARGQRAGLRSRLRRALERGPLSRPRRPDRDRPQVRSRPHRRPRGVLPSTAARDPRRCRMGVSRVGAPRPAALAEGRKCVCDEEALRREALPERGDQGPVYGLVAAGRPLRRQGKDSGRHRRFHPRAAGPRVSGAGRREPGRSRPGCAQSPDAVAGAGRPKIRQVVGPGHPRLRGLHARGEGRALDRRGRSFLRGCLAGARDRLGRRLARRRGAPGRGEGREQGAFALRCGPGRRSSRSGGRRPRDSRSSRPRAGPFLPDFSAAFPMP